MKPIFTFLGMARERILITGATGFIGQYLVTQALAEGYEVWAAVRSPANRRVLRDPRIRFIDLDYSSPGAIAAQADALAPSGLPAWHYVIHNAGITKARDKHDFIRINANQTKTLAEGLAAAAEKPERFLLISSLSVYRPIGSDEIITENTPREPRTTYGLSKLMAEEFLSESGLPYTILNLTGVYGPGDTDYLTALKAIRRGINFMAGLHPQLLTFVYAEDVARAVFFTLKAKAAQNRRFAVSDGQTYTDRSFGEIAARLLNHRRVLHLRAPLALVRIICSIGEIINRRAGGLTPLNNDKYRILAQRSWRCDNTPLQSIGFKPRIDLKEGLRRTIVAAHLI